MNYSLFNDYSQENNHLVKYTLGGGLMISYSPFWETLHASNESTYTLINKYHLSSSTIDKLRKNKPLNTTTINDLCRILDCTVENIMKYEHSDDDQAL